MEVSQNVKQLLAYAELHGLLSGMDIILAENLILDLLQIKTPWDNGETTPQTDIDAILAPILDYALEQGLISQDTVTARDIFEGRIFTFLTPRQREIETDFKDIQKNEGIEKATDYFYSLSKATNYIKTNRIKKDVYWKHQSPYVDMEITINLSKPEKDPKDIAAAKDAPTGYPKCLLCIENVGYPGHMAHPPRQNHRILPITLGGEQWYFQYSPYSYYNEHCIPLNAQHRPIQISEATFVKLFDFLEIMPHYFVGSNADLPISGGSILSHDHFQGGRHKFPIDFAKVEKTFKIGEVHAHILAWPMSVLRLVGDKDEILKTASKILAEWRNYSNESIEILSHTNNTPHNTITPIARVNQGQYELDLVLRNNRTNDKHPLGIFHPHNEVHHIKKENIGLIEVMGLAILPGRLKGEIEDIKEILRGRREITASLDQHKDWIRELKASDKSIVSQQNAESSINDLIKHSIGNKFVEVLRHAGVFKEDMEGREAFTKFVIKCGGVC